MTTDDPTHPDSPDEHSPLGPIIPLPVPGVARELLLVGGSFDPPTLAHMRIADRARSAVFGRGAWVVFVPAARSPFKPDPPAADTHRAAMLRLSLRGLPRAAVWTDELDRAAGGPSYWIDTLGRARLALPGAEFRFLIGADQAVEFHRWRAAHEVLRLATPVVLLRSPWPDAALLVEHLGRLGEWSDDELEMWRGAVLPLPPISGSATEAREALARLPRDGGPPGSELGGLLDPAVVEYIRAHELYTGDGRPR